MQVATLTAGGATAASTTIHAPSSAPLLPRLASADEMVDFVRDVRPILSSKCFACHGPDATARKAGLSLVDFESATMELDPGIAAIVPGDLKASEAWLRINDATDPMPPRECEYL